jgi:hypothetical protein
MAFVDLMASALPSLNSIFPSSMNVHTIISIVT